MDANARQEKGEKEESLIQPISHATSDIRYAHTNLIGNDWKRLADFYCTVFECVAVSSERNHHGLHIDALTSMPSARIQGRHLRLMRGHE